VCFINFPYQASEKVSDSNKKKLPNVLTSLLNTCKMYNRTESNFNSKNTRTLITFLQL